MSTEQLGAAAAFLASCTWALGSTTYGRLAERYSAAVINTTRAGLALVGFIVAMLFFDFDGSRAAFSRMTLEGFTWLFVSIFSSYAFGDVLFLASATIIGVPLALTLASIFPIWSAAAGFFLHGEALRAVQTAGLVVTVVGVAIVVLTGAKGRHGEKPLIGYLLGLTTSIFWAMNTIGVERGSEGLSTLVIGGVRMAIAFVLCPAVGFILRQKIWPPFLAPADMRKYGGICFFEAFAGTIFFVYAFAHIPLAVAGTLASLAPVLSVPVAYFMNKEPVSLQKVLGILVVTAGVVLLLQ